MRDLTCVARKRIPLSDGFTPVASAWHKDTVYLVAHTQPTSGASSFRIASADLKSRQTNNIIKVDLVALHSSGTQVRTFVYLADGGSAVDDEPALCLITAGGDIVLVSLQQDEQGGLANPSPQIVGSVEQGILSASWSPDEETVILVVPADEGAASTSADPQPEKLLVMSREFEVLDEKIIREQGRGEEQVSVGWGSKTTQFHGTAGKAAARIAEVPEGEEQAPTTPVTPLPDDDHLPHISWRGDCAFFVISSLEKVDTGTRRIIRIFDRSGNLTAVSDDTETGLTHVAAMKPTGNIIATTQRFDPGAPISSGTYAKGRRHRHDVVFFERNGLRRGAFSLREEEGATVDGQEGGITEPPLPDKDLKAKMADDSGWSRQHSVISVQWNSDASCLAVWLRRAQYDVVQVWTTANWHWYLKQEIKSEVGASLQSVQWHVEDPLQLVVVLDGRDGTSARLDAWTFRPLTFNQPSTGPAALSSGVAVTDGGVQRVTFFDQQTVPPPMCGVVLPSTQKAVWRTSLNNIATWPADGSDAEHDFTARHKAWTEAALTSGGPRKQMASILALLHPDGRTVYLYAFVFASPKSPPTVLYVGQVTSDAAIDGRLVAINAWTNNENEQHIALGIAVLGELQDGQASVSYRQGILSQGADHTLSLGKFTEVKSVALPSQLAHGESVLVTRSTEEAENAFLVHHISGIIDSAFDNQDEEYHIPLADLGHFCPTVQVAQASDAPGSERFIVGLTDTSMLLTSRLSVEQSSSTVLARDATSFVISPPFLIWTNTHHEARFLPLASLSGPITQSTSEVVSLDRRVERGSRIVSAVPRQMALILQMPRGNLERVYPRCMVLDRVRKELDVKRYRAAFLHCRSHRVDLNVIYDHNPEAFLADVGTFIDQVNDVDHFNLFLSSLRGEDVTESLYKPLHGTSTASSTKPSVEAKVNGICDAFITRLTALGDDRRWINSILTAHVKKVPADYEAALALLRDMKTTDPTLVDVAIEYIIFLAPFDSLFDVALGMYDLTLALMVAQHSKKKDPREYLPFLRGLREVEPEARRNFQIDDHLRRYGKALTWLAKVQGDHDEAMVYMDRHRLFAEGFRAWAEEPKKWRQAQGLYGEYLLGRQKWTDAAMAFQLAGDIPQALEAFRNAGAWQDAFALALVDKRPASEITSLASTMALRLEETARHSEAARVKLEYGRDIEGAVESYGKANEITECRRICAAYQRLDLIETHVKPAGLQVQSTLIEDIGTMSEQLTKQMARLAELQVKKEAEPAAFYGEDGGGATGLDNVDVQSDTSTQITQFTRYTKAPTHAGTLSSISASSRGTGITSKKHERKLKKKEEKKKASGKKGSVYEEDYLYESIQRLVKEKLGEVQDDVAKLLPNLVVLGAAHREAGFELHQALASFEKQAEAAIGALDEVATQAGVAADEARIAALTASSGVNLSAPTAGLLELLAGTTWMDKAAQRKKLELSDKKWKSEMLETTMKRTK